jgi:methyl-accepting chemotaxis protein
MNVLKKIGTFILVGLAILALVLLYFAFAKPHRRTESGTNEDSERLSDGINGAKERARDIADRIESTKESTERSSDAIKRASESVGRLDEIIDRLEKFIAENSR